MDHSAPSLVDLFCGVGGISLGFAQAGFRVLGGNDFDQHALEAFALNHPDAVTWPGNLEELKPETLLHDLELAPGELDVLAGGPPCQGFSRNRARRHLGGRFVDDPRNYLFKEFLRFVEYVRPRLVLIENVPEILIKHDGLFGREIIESLLEVGYETRTAVLNSIDFGVPQKRRRAFFLAGRGSPPSLPVPTHGQRNGSERQLQLIGAGPEPEPIVTIRDAIGDLAGLGEGESCSSYPGPPTSSYQKERRDCGTELTDHVGWEMSPVQRERLSYLSEGDGFKQLPERLRPKSGYGSAYRRMSWDIPALTITTWMYHPGSGMFFHPSDERTISLREGARLQSFDDSVRFVGGKVAKCRQVGNAVPPLLARAIGSQALRYLRDG